MKYGAPGGNRTRVTSLGSWCSTIELQMRKKDYKKRAGICLVAIFAVWPRAGGIIRVGKEKIKKISESDFKQKQWRFAGIFIEKTQKPLYKTPLL